MDIREHISPRKDKEGNVIEDGKAHTPLNMLLIGYPEKNGDGYMIHAYFDHSGVRGLDKDPSKFDKVEVAPYLTPKQSGRYMVDGAVHMSGKMIDMLKEKGDVKIDPVSGRLTATITTTMTQRQGQWQPDISNASGTGYGQTARKGAAKRMETAQTIKDMAVDKGVFAKAVREGATPEEAVAKVAENKEARAAARAARAAEKAVEAADTKAPVQAKEPVATAEQPAAETPAVEDDDLNF
jgi:hypothetical protein